MVALAEPFGASLTGRYSKEENVITLTTPEENLLRPWLIERIQTGAKTINYKALAEELDPDGSLGWNDGGRYKRLSHALYHIAHHEVERGRPVGLVALVINKLRGASGGGFATMARGLRFEVGESTAAENQFWELKLAEAIDYWAPRRSADGALTDAQFDTLMRKLTSIERMLRQLVHA